MAFTSPNHYLDADWLRYAYECTRKDGAVGVDGQTAQEYAANLEQNLQDLMDRLKSGRDRALPVRRHYIDKSDGSRRALGIPSFEEKEALFRVLSPKRWELVERLQTLGSTSMRGLARELSIARP